MSSPCQPRVRCRAVCGNSDLGCVCGQPVRRGAAAPDVERAAWRVFVISAIRPGSTARAPREPTASLPFVRSTRRERLLVSGAARRVCDRGRPRRSCDPALAGRRARPWTLRPGLSPARRRPRPRRSRLTTPGAAARGLKQAAGSPPPSRAGRFTRRRPGSRRNAGRDRSRAGGRSLARRARGCPAAVRTGARARPATA
jgi:hypothetical protein